MDKSNGPDFKPQPITVNAVLDRIISLIKNKKNCFFKMSDSYIFLDETNTLGDGLKQIGVEFEKALALCIELKENGLLIDTIINDSNGSLFVDKQNSYYKKILELLD